MTPLIVQRGIRAPLIVVLMFSWLVASTASGQSQAPASQPAEKDQKTDQPVPQPTAKPVPEPTSQPVVRPVERPSSAPATYPATLEAQERFRKFQEMRQAAVKNGHQTTVDMSQHPASQPERQPTAAGQPKPSTRRPPPRHTPAGAEEIRRRALASRDQRQAAARKAREGAQSQPAVDEEETAAVEPEAVPTSKPAASQPLTTATRPEASPTKRPGPPAELAEKPVEPPPPSADGRDYFISFVDMGWEDVIAHYAKLVGKPLMKDVGVSPFGELTYESPRRFTKEEMRDELNFLLLGQGYFIIEKEDYVYLVPTSELTKELELDHVFDSVEAFEAAKLRDLEICSVLIQIKDRPAEQIRDMLSPSMPDRALPVVVGNTNKIKITGLAQDVRRFQGLLQVVETEEYDPRETRFIKVETNVSQIEQMVRNYFKISAPRRQYNRETRQFETVGGDEEIVIIADERTKNLIVKATPAKLAEIEKFIKEIDQAPDLGEFKTTVIPVRYGNATDIAKLLNDILQQEQGERARPTYRPPTRTTPSSRSRTRTPTPQQAQPAAPEDIIVEDIYERAKKTVRIVADERTNNLVVYANEDGLKRVTEILEQIDQPVPSNFRTFRLEHAEADQIQPTIEQIARGTSPSGGRGRTGQALSIVADTTLNALHVVADREDMNRIETIVQELDVEAPEDQWHFVELTNITASQAASMIAPVLDLDGTSPVRRPSRGGRRMGPVRATATSKTIPLDEANTLIVICSDEEWEKAEQIIKIADESAISNRPEIRFFTVENGNPQTIASTVSQLYANYEHPVLGRSRTFVDTLGQQIVVQGIKPALEEIESLVKSLDVAVEENPIVILQLEHADASDVAEIAQGLLPPDARGRGRRDVGGPGASVQADLVTNSLIIQADRLTVDRIKAFVAEREQQVAAQKPERRYYSLKHAAPRDVVSAISSLFDAVAGGGRFRGRGPVGTQVKTVIVGNQVVVDAPASKQLEVASLVEQLDTLSDKGVTTVLVKMPGADVNSIASRLNNAFRDRIREQDVVARFDPDTLTETILMTCSRDVIEDAEALLKEYRELSSEMVWETTHRSLKHAEANDAANWLREQLMSLMSQQMPTAVVRQIKVSPDNRTNRVFINAPQVAVKQGLLLLDEYDQPAEEAPQSPVEMWTVQLPGLDVRSLASNLQRNLDNMPRRPDRLRAVLTADQLTNTLIISAPRDMKEQIDAFIAEFTAQSPDLTPIQKFVQIQSADANYVAGQLSSILNQRISRTRGSSVAQQVNVQVDARLNRVILNAPAFAIEMAEALITELDQPPTTESQLQTIPLANADANTVNGVLRTIFNEKIRARTLSISVEPLTNSLIVGGSKEDFADIKKWAEDLDASAGEAVSEQKIFELKNANPWEVNNVLQQTFVQKRRGVVIPPGKEIQTAIIAGRSIMVTAPPEKMKEIEELIIQLDEIGANQAVVRTYELVGMGNRLNELARQLQNAVNQQISGVREQRITITAYPPADALIVTALENQFELVEQMMDQFKSLMEVAKAKIEFFQLEYVDAGQIAGTVQNLVQTRIRSGGRSSRGADEFSVTPDPRTNRLIVFAPESILPDVREVVKQLDVPAPEEDVFTIDLKYADPWETRNMINDIFSRSVRGAVNPSEQVYVTVSNSTLVVKAPPKKLKQIQDLLAKIDAENPNQLQIKMYDLKVLNATQVSGQVQLFLRSFQKVTRRGEMQPGAFAEPTTNTLVVIAPGDQLPFIDTLISQIETKVPDAAIMQTYVLVNARADQVQRHVDQMLKAKIAEREGDQRGRTMQQRTAVMGDPETNRLFVFAPPDYQQLAAELIKMVDEEVDTGEIVHIIPLENGEATQVAQTVTQTMQGGGVRGGGTAPMKVKVVPDVGSNSILLAGLPKDVAEIERLVKDLEAASDTIPELQYFTLEFAQTFEVAEALRGMFPPARNIAESVTVTEDDYYNRLLVSANKRKMRQVEAIVEQLDTPPDEEGGFGLGGGKELYFVEVFRGDPYDIAWDVSDLLPPKERGGPEVEADLFGQYIRVMCRPSEYPQVERLIHQFDKRAKPEIVFRAIHFLGDRERLLEYLQAREVPYDLVRPPTGMEKTESIIIDLHPEAEERTDQRTPDAPATSRRDGAAPHLFGGVVLTMLLQDERTPEQTPAQPPDTLFSTGTDEEPLQRQPASLQMLPDGRLVLHGPRDAVEEIEDAVALFEEDLSRGEVIRIFRFHYGDVNAASRILDMMFNERQIRLPQARQQQQPQQQQRGRPGREGEQKEEQPQSMVQQLQQMIGGRQEGGTTTGGQRVRVATDASHNYLIVKCDEALLPDIIQLLRELDIPPAEVDVEVIQLKNLEAAETANNIKEVLGITKAGTRRPTAQASRGGSPQQQLMEMIQQQMVSVGGEVSAKIESVEIVPNSITNSLLVSAPKDVMTIIKDVVIRMEGLEGGDVTVIKHYPLTQAKVDDVLPLLQDIFGAAGGTGGRGPRGGGSPADLGPVTISGDPRSNTIIYVCQAKDVETVNTQIEKLDIEGAVAEIEMYICKYGDAVGIAEVVSEMFATDGPGGAGGRGARGRGVSQVANLDIRISAEPATNTILVFAPAEKRELIIDQIEKLDRENRFDIREIPVAFAKPDRVADKLLQIFGGTGGSTMTAGPGGRGGARRQATQTPGRIVVIPDESAKKLLVRAPDEIFAKMQEIVALLDQPSEQLLIRTFPLRHADATIVVDSVKAALLEFMQLQKQLGGEELDIDAFTAMADPRTNSVVVVGSEETFLFVERVIAAVDGDVPADREKQFRIFVLDRSDAQTVADAINSFATGGGGSQGGRSGGRRGGLTAGAGANAPLLDVQAIADTATNSVVVYGRLEDIKRVEEDVITQWEGAVSSWLKFATIEVKEAVPTELVSVIQDFLDQAAGPGESGGRGRGGAVPTRQPRIIANDNAGTILVYGSPRQIDEIQTLAARFDTKDLRINQWEIIPVPWGQDAFNLASLVQDSVNSSEQEAADRTGRQPRLITANADEHSNAIIVFGEPSQLAIAKTIVGQLKEIRPEKPVTRIIELVNLSSAEAEQLIGDLQERRSSGGSIRGGSRSGSSSRRPPTSGGSSSQRRPSSRSGSRPRSWNWNPSPDGLRYAAAPAGFATPVMGTTVAMPRLVSLLVTQDPQQPDVGSEQPAAKEEQPVTPREEQQQQMLSSISGQLRGEVVATPLDSRRIIVTGDADDVDFIVQMLALMERSTPAPVIRVFTLLNTKAAAVAPVLDQTMQALIRTQGGGDRVDNFSIIAEGRSNSLIVSASETNMERIAELIEALDITTGVTTQPKLVALKHIRAAEAFQLLEDPIKRLNEIREVPANAQATIQAVERSNAILVVGTPADISEIEKLIAGIDVELPPEDDFSTAKIYVVDLKNAVAEDLADTLTELLAMEKAARPTGGSQAGKGNMPLLRRLIFTMEDGRELPPLDLDKPIVIIAEKGKNSLVIFSSEKNSESMLEIVRLFDSLPIGEEVEVKTFVLKHGNAEEVAKLLEDTFDEAKKALQRPSSGDSNKFDKGVMPPVPPGLAGRGLPYNLVVQHDVRSNTVVVIGRKDAVLLAAGLVTELDRPSAELNVKPYVIQIKQANVTTMQKTLEELLNDRAKALGVDKNTARDSAVIKVDDRSNRLIVVATPEMYQMVEELATELDRAEPYSVVGGRFRRLKYADAAKLAGLLQQYFDKKKDAERDVTESGQKQILSVFADARSNSLMFAATRDYLDEANQLVDNLDQAFDPTVQFKLHTVRLNSAVNIAQLLTDMIDASRKDQTKEMQGTPIHVAADPYSNNLLLAASQEDMLMLERWVEVLDRPTEVGRITKIIPVMRGKADDLAKSAQDLFQTKVKGADADVTVVSDPTSNSIIAIGPPTVVNDIEDFVARLNNADGAGAVVKIFKLEQADAQDAGDLLRSILEGQSGSVGGGTRGSSGGKAEEFNQAMLIFQRQHPELGLETLKALRKEIVVIDDLRTNSLVIIAPPEGMALMESLVCAIDVPPDSAKIRVFRLRNSDAEEMVTMLEELFQPTQQAAGRAGESQQELQLTLGEGLAEGGRQQLAFTVDTRTNSVIAAGTTGYLDLVEELILKLDTQPIEDRKTIVFQPHNNEATAIQQVINEYNDAEQSRLNELKEEISVSKRMERNILTIASEDTNRIVLDYDPRRESDVLELVRDLDQPPPQVMIQVLIVEVTMDNSLELGVEFAFQDLQWSKAGTTDTTTFDFVGGTDIGAAGTGLGGFTFTITGADFNFLIRTLQNEGNLKVLSRPQIVAMDNQEAHIKITNDVPYVAGSTVTATGIVQSNVSRREVGIELTVTPHINPDGFVRMEILQTVSDITGSTIDVGQGLTSPIFLDREAETAVVVKDNETVVLGGLIKTRDEEREQKVPILGDIPLLGWLARNQDVDSERTELLVILTPRVVRTIEDYRELSFVERDHTGYLPDEVLTNELMSGLRVAPEDLAPEAGEDMLGPFPKTSQIEEAPDEKLDEEIYGPTHSSASSAEDEDQPADADSYDVPISWAGHDSKWTDPGTGQH